MVGGSYYIFRSEGNNLEKVSEELATAEAGTNTLYKIEPDSVYKNSVRV